MTLPQWHSRKIVCRNSLMRIDVATPGGDAADDPLEVRSQCRRWFGYRFSDIDLPEVVKFNGNVDSDSGEPDQVIGRHDSEPTSRNDKTTAAIDVEPVSSLEAFPPASSLQVIRLQA